VGILFHPKGETWSKHTHFRAIEYNVLLDGKMRMQGQELNRGDVFIMSPYEIADPEFLEDCRVLVVKVPSVPKDKVNVSYDN
jgi:quercetin dioxygenase-like cupin family protein